MPCGESVSTVKVLPPCTTHSRLAFPPHVPGPERTGIGPWCLLELTVSVADWVTTCVEVTWVLESGVGILAAASPRETKETQNRSRKGALSFGDRFEAGGSVIVCVPR